MQRILETILSIYDCKKYFTIGLAVEHVLKIHNIHFYDARNLKNDHMMKIFMKHKFLNIKNILEQMISFVYFLFSIFCVIVICDIFFIASKFK